MLEQMLDELDQYKGVSYMLHKYRSAYSADVTYYAQINRELDGDKIEIKRNSHTSCSDALELALQAFRPLLEAYPKRERFDNLLSAPLSQDEELRSNIEEPF